MIARRALIAAPALLLARPALADVLCRNTPPGRICEAGLAVDAIKARQDKPNWCWAAVVQAILGFHGMAVTQEAVVQRVFGTTEDAPAPGAQVALAINGAWDDVNGDGWEVACEVLIDQDSAFAHSQATRIVAAELAAGNPLVLGGLGHAMVLAGMVYAETPAGPQPLELHLVDPWPLGPGRRVVAGPGIAATSFLARLVVE
ncbi:MAG: papain-like cysteine protease family protein [Sphingomonadales bacterium]